ANYNNEGVSRLRDGVWRNWSANDACTSGCDTTFLTSSFPFGALADPDGTKWIGIWSGPMVHFDDTVDPSVFQNIINVSGDPIESHLHTCVWSSAADSNHVDPSRSQRYVQQGRWFGLDTDKIGEAGFNPIGIDVYDSAGTLRRSFQPGYPNLRNGQVRALAVDKDNVMWVGYAKNSNAGVATFPVPAVLGDSITLTDVKDTNVINCYGIQIY